MKPPIKPFAALLLVLLAAVASHGAASLPASDFDLAIDPDGTIWMGRLTEGSVVLSRWAGVDWLEERRVEAEGLPGKLRLVMLGSRLTALWIEAGGVAMLTGDQGSPVQRPKQLRGCFSDLAAAAVEDGQIGLLLVSGEGDGPLLYCELDASSGFLRHHAEIKSEGDASSPSIIGGKEIWLAWQERSEAGLKLVAVGVDSGVVGEVKRFKVRGFGGSASPVLARTANGSVTLVWQGTKGKWEAALHVRSLSEGGLGPVRPAELPEGVSGVLAPKTVTGDSSLIVAYGWCGGMRGNWVGVKYALEADGGFRYELRGIGGTDILEPRLAADMAGNEVWIWRGGDQDRDKLTTKPGGKLEVKSSKGILPEAAEGDYIYALAFGDSITEGKEVYNGESTLSRGYLPYLEDLYSEHVSPMAIIQDGVGGDTTAEGLVRLPTSLAENPQVKFVLILFGTNDAFGGVDPQIVADNLGTMADMVRDAGAIPVVATLMPRFDEGPKERAEAVSEAIYPMARLRGITICDFQKLFPKDQNLFSDLRLHPNQEGYAKMAEYWFPALVTFEGDVDRSLTVDQNDLLLFTAVFQTLRGGWGFNPDADFNDDGHIDVADLAHLIASIGRSFLPVNLLR
jgi:lysophospholipase L1-like esterase